MPDEEGLANAIRYAMTHQYDEVGLVDDPEEVYLRHRSIDDRDEWYASPREMARMILAALTEGAA